MAKVATTCIDCGRKDEIDGPEGIMHKTIRCRWCIEHGVLPNGTKVRFTKTLDAPANEERPAVTYATKGETGEITGHGTREGYWVKTKLNPPFGAGCDEFEVL